MNRETKDYLVQIRVTFNERENIKKRAEKAGKNLSNFLRESALRL